MSHTDDELKKACGDLHYEMWMLNKTADLLEEEQARLLQESSGADRRLVVWATSNIYAFHH